MESAITMTLLECNGSFDNTTYAGIGYIFKRWDGFTLEAGYVPCQANHPSAVEGLDLLEALNLAEHG